MCMGMRSGGRLGALNQKELSKMNIFNEYWLAFKTFRLILGEAYNFMSVREYIDMENEL